MLKLRGISNIRNKTEYVMLAEIYQRSPRKLSSQPKGDSSEGKAAEELSADSMKRQVHVPNNIDRYMLVWAKKYPSLQEVPAEVPQHTMERTRNVIRIRINIIMVGITIVTCFIMALLGRRAAEKGESIAKTNLDWHKQINKANGEK